MNFNRVELESRIVIMNWLTFNHYNSLCICKAAPEMSWSCVEGAKNRAICSRILPLLSVRFTSAFPWIRLKTPACRNSTATKKGSLGFRLSRKGADAWTFNALVINSGIPILAPWTTAERARLARSCSSFNANSSSHAIRRSSLACVCANFVWYIFFLPIITVRYQRPERKGKRSEVERRREQEQCKCLWGSVNEFLYWSESDYILYTRVEECWASNYCLHIHLINLTVFNRISYK